MRASLRHRLQPASQALASKDRGDDDDVAITQKDEIV
jgi:hypothetical protein